MLRLLSPKILCAVGACALSSKLLSTKRRIAFAQENDDNQFNENEFHNLKHDQRILQLMNMIEKLQSKSAPAQELLPAMETALKVIEALPEGDGSNNIYYGIGCLMAFHLAEWEKLNLLTARAQYGLVELQMLSRIAGSIFPDYKDVAEALIWFKKSNVFELLNLSIEELQQQDGVYTVTEFNSRLVFSKAHAFPPQAPVELPDTKLIASGAVATCMIDNDKFSGLISTKGEGAIVIQKDYKGYRLILNKLRRCLVVERYILSKNDQEAPDGWKGYKVQALLCPVGSRLYYDEMHTEIKMKLKKVSDEAKI